MEALQGSSARPVLNNKTTTMNPGAVKFFDALFFVHWQPRNQRKTLQLVLKSLNSQKIGFKKRGSAMPITRPWGNVFPRARLRPQLWCADDRTPCQFMWPYYGFVGAWTCLLAFTLFLTCLHPPHQPVPCPSHLQPLITLSIRLDSLHSHSASTLFFKPCLECCGS